MLLLGLAVSLAAGAALGLFGGGGSLLILPALVYVFGRPPLEATAYSLVIVAVVSTAGAWLHSRHQRLPVRRIASFGIPSVAAAYFVRAAVVPRLPARVALGPIDADRDLLLMLAFAALTAASGGAMLWPRRAAPSAPGASSWVPLAGAATGAMTGLLGAGGGFLVVPALVVLVGLEMKEAVNASLALVAAQTVAGAAGAFGAIPAFDLRLVAALTATMLLGLAWGVAAAQRTRPMRLRRAFGGVLLLVAAATAVQQLT